MALTLFAFLMEYQFTEKQVRIVVQGDGSNTAWLVDNDDRSRICVWPDALAQTQCKVLTLGLDQGSVGAAGVAFASMWLGLLIYARWDKYHRVVRDIRLAISHVGAGVFLKAQLYTSYLWGVNYKPFGTGAFSTQKKTSSQRVCIDPLTCVTSFF